MPKRNLIGSAAFFYPSLLSAILNSAQRWMGQTVKKSFRPEIAAPLEALNKKVLKLYLGIVKNFYLRVSTYKNYIVPQDCWHNLVKQRFSIKIVLERKILGLFKGRVCLISRYCCHQNGSPLIGQHPPTNNRRQ